jgi:hypothetical protein
VELAVPQLPIGDGGMTEQQCSAGSKLHIDYCQNRSPKLTPDNSRVRNYHFPDLPITPDNSQFFPRGSPNNGISLGGILFYF